MEKWAPCYKFIYNKEKSKDTVCFKMTYKTITHLQQDIYLCHLWYRTEEPHFLWIDILGVILKDGGWFFRTHPSTDRTPQLIWLEWESHLCMNTLSHTGTGSHRVCMHKRTRTHMQQSFLAAPYLSTRHPLSPSVQLHVEGFNPRDTTLLLNRKREMETRDAKQLKWTKG